MSYYMAPALLGLALKLLILVYALKSRRSDALLISLILVFALHNSIELFGYALLIDGQTVSMLFRSYYVVTIFGLLFICNHAFNTSKLSLPGANYTLTACALVIGAGIVLSDSIVAGHYSIGYAISAIKGEYYAAFALFCMAALLVAIGSLLLGLRKAINELEANRCIYSLVALAPFALISPIILTFKIFGVDINAAGLTPLATTFFVYVMLKGESDHKLTDIRRFLPFSVERRSAARFLELTDAYAQKVNKTNAFAELRDGIERQAIVYTIEKCDGNISETARMMGLQNRSTLYSMMKRLKIDPPSVARAKSSDA